MKQSFLKFLGIACLVITFGSCTNEAAKTEAAAGFNIDSAKAAIAASNKVFGACFANSDSVAFANCYASDGCIYNANMPKVCGKAGIQSFLSMGYQSGIRNVVLTTDEVMGGKEAVVETGKYEVFVANNVSVEKGKFVVVWKEENGKWKMYRDIWNSDAPPPQGQTDGVPEVAPK
jgi:ketosteroid isomerase-like protein